MSFAVFLEQWRPVKGYEGMYDASSYGRVRSLDRESMTSRGVWHIRGRILRPRPGHAGHRALVLCRSGEHITRYVHHLVLEAFVDPRPDGMEGCHNDGNAGNNHVRNLRWDTHRRNMDDTESHGTRRRGDELPQAKLSADDVRRIRQLLSRGGYSQGAIAKMFGVKPSTVWAISMRRSWSHVA